MHRVTYTIITNHYATLYELTHNYTIDEAIDLYEACLVSLHNKVAGIQSLKKPKGE